MRNSFGKTAVGKAIIAAFLAAIFLKLLVFDFMVAEGHSMAPVIQPGNIIIVCKIFYGIRLPLSGTYLVRWRTPQAGDIVVFFTPLGEIAVKRSTEILPGERFMALGDNSYQSYDSRNYGPVPFDNIIGRVLFRR